MKFGKYLLDQGVPAWADSYLNYKLLKIGIKRVVAAQKQQQRLGRGADDSRALPPDLEGPPLGTPEQEEAAFERTLTAELEKISLFYLARESEFIAQYARVYEPSVKAALMHADRLSPDLTELGEFFEYCRAVDDLRNFTVLNYIGVLKILKKFDKKTDGQLKVKWAPLLMKEPFYTSTALAALFTEVQCMCAQLIWHVKKVAPAPQDFTCPICQKILHDPIVLSCTDRFCRTCLAAVVNGVDGSSRNKCPKCQKVFDSLDPSSYHVDNILAKFVSAYFPRTPAGWTPATHAIDALLTRSNPPSLRGSPRASPLLLPQRELPLAGLDAMALPAALLESSHAPLARSAHPSAASAVIELSMAPDHAYAARLAGERPRSLYGTALDLRSTTPHASDAGSGKEASFFGDSAHEPWFRSVWHHSTKSWIGRMLVAFDVARRSRDPTRLVLALAACMGAVLVLGSVGVSTLGQRSPNDLPELADFAMARPAVTEFPDTVFVGHKHNDADSICSAIAAAHLYHGSAARSDAINRETAYLLNRFQLEAPLPSTDASFAQSNWCLLDHNQKDKVPEGVNLGRLVCVIDHHQLQANAVEVVEPRSVEIQPWGSTATILAFKYVQHGILLPPPIAGCLLGGILSDTVNLRGPTTTPTDRMAAEYLARVAGVESVTDFVNEMFAAKSDTSGLDVREIVTTDYKQFSMIKRRLGFGVAETISPRDLVARKAEILAELSDLKKRDGLDLMFFAIVDVVNLRSVLLGASTEEERIILEGFQATPLGAHLFDGRSLVSRKKDFIPILTRFLRADADRRGIVLDDY